MLPDLYRAAAPARRLISRLAAQQGIPCGCNSFMPPNALCRPPVRILPLRSACGSGSTLRANPSRLSKMQKMRPPPGVPSNIFFWHLCCSRAPPGLAYD